jgi:hypothetical protein
MALLLFQIEAKDKKAEPEANDLLCQALVSAQAIKAPEALRIRKIIDTHAMACNNEKSGGTST